MYPHSPHRLNALSEAMGESLLRLSDYLSTAPADKVRGMECIKDTRRSERTVDVHARGSID